MNELQMLGKIIKDKRLSLNLRMDDVAKKANITRSTLWSIERGDNNCSIGSILKVMNLLDLSFNVDSSQHKYRTRDRASRVNTALDKKINRFIVMCVEQYASSRNRSSKIVYQEMLDKGVVKELIDDYEDLHGMSTVYLNEYIDALLRKE